MGTNYYVEDEPTCDNPAHVGTLHVGKSSFGWLFGFHAIPEKGLTSWSAWREYLKVAEAHDRPITDEYGRTQTLEEFAAFVEGKQNSVGRDPNSLNLSHADYMAQHYPGETSRRYYRDDDGYEMHEGEFS